MHEQANKRDKLPRRDELVAVSSSSRFSAEYNPYRLLKVYQDEDPTFGPVEFFEHFPVFRIPQHSNDQIHVVKEHQEHRLDLIAWDFYGSHLWWWVIYLAQDPVLEDPIKDIVTGRVLRIPYLPGLLMMMR